MFKSDEKQNLQETTNSNNDFLFNFHLFKMLSCV